MACATTQQLPVDIDIDIDIDMGIDILPIDINIYIYINMNIHIDIDIVIDIDLDIDTDTDTDIETATPSARAPQPSDCGSAVWRHTEVAKVTDIQTSADGRQNMTLERARPTDFVNLGGIFPRDWQCPIKWYNDSKCCSCKIDLLYTQKGPIVHAKGTHSRLCILQVN